MRQRDYQQAARADLHVQAINPFEGYQLLAVPSALGEADEMILSRVAHAQAYPRPATDQVDAAAMRLMQAAIRQLCLESDLIAALWRIASVIAQCAASPQIGAAHLAEAIQYRRRIPIWYPPVS